MGSAQVLSPVAINGCQVSLLRGFHPNSSLETAEGLLASRKAGALPMQTAQRTEGGEGVGSGLKGGSGGQHFTGFTPTHTPKQISQLGLHLTLDSQPTKQTGTEG